LADGTRAAKLQIVSPDAAALRVALQVSATDPDLSVRFSGNAPNAGVFGPIPANTIANDTARFGMFSSPERDGDVAPREFHADVACVPQTTAFVNSTKAVTQTLTTWADGSTWLCTGTLLNDSTSSNTAYFFAANHCLDDDNPELRSTHGAASARTFNTFWFFDAVACGNHTP